MAQTFAEMLINNILPKGMRITRPVDSSYLGKLLEDVYRKHPDEYDRVVTELAALGNKFSTLDGGITIGLDEITVPDKKARDTIVKEHSKKIMNAKTEDEQIKHMTSLQESLFAQDQSKMTDSASLMVRSALGGKKFQLMKMRTGPGVVKGYDQKIVPEVFTKSYSEGVDPLHYWLGAAEARANLAEGQVSTAKPGELNKVLTNVLNSIVVSMEDCKTKNGIMLKSDDVSVLDRYLSRDTGMYKAGTLVTTDVQTNLIKAGIDLIMVRSPQTCQAKENTVCVKCMGLKPSTGQPYKVGDAAGLTSAGVLAEPLVQMTLSAKHSTSLAKVEEGLVGEKGFRKFVEMPASFSNKKILCEVYGEVVSVMQAPQGGTIVTVKQTKLTPERYIEVGKPAKRQFKGMKYHYDYYIPPNLKVDKGITKGAQTYPGLALSTGFDNLKDIARLRNLGLARSAASENMYQIYKNTNNTLDRRHFEILSRAAHKYVQIMKAPAGFPVHRGETVEYDKLEKLMAKIPNTLRNIDSAMDMVLVEGIGDVSIGTQLTKPVIDHLKQMGIKQVKATADLEVAPVITPLTRAVDEGTDWLSKLNHRRIKDALVEMATTGQRSNLHGYKPINAYAYGVEMGKGPEGKY